MKASDVTKTTASLAWEEPDFNGGSPVTGYYVEKKSGTRWVKVNKKPISKLTLDMDDLIEGDTYEIRVSAENDAGVGSPCEPISFVAKDPFDAPGQPDAPIVEEILPEEASLAWTPPVDDGGAPITGYIVEMKPKGDAKWKKATKDEIVEPKLKVNGMKEGVEYEFRVTAQNKAGSGPASQPTKAKYGEDSFTGLEYFHISQLY